MDSDYGFNWIIIIQSAYQCNSYQSHQIIKKLVKLLTINFNGNLNCLFIYNPPKIITMTWYVVQKLMEKETTEKIKFIKKDQFDQILDKISQEQLESRFGGVVQD